MLNPTPTLDRVELSSQNLIQLGDEETQPYLPHPQARPYFKISAFYFIAELNPTNLNENTKIYFIIVIGETPQGQTSAAQAGTAGPGSSGQCLVGCLGKTKRELQTFGTSRLRPEAAAHRVHNASRKPKDQVRLNICLLLIGLLTIFYLTSLVMYAYTF